MNRLDYRDLNTFKKDILFSTKLEEFWFKLYIKQIALMYDKIEYEDSGTDNTGEFQTKATNNADYTIYLHNKNNIIIRKLDIKWAPTKGKATFKVKNLNHYIKDNINILLFYNTGLTRLIKPKNYNIQQHICKIQNNLHNIKYGIITTSSMKTILNTYEQRKNWNMGNRLSVEIPSNNFSNHFEEKQVKI